MMVENHSANNKKTTYLQSDLRTYISQYNSNYYQPWRQSDSQSKSTSQQMILQIGRT